MSDKRFWGILFKQTITEARFGAEPVLTGGLFLFEMMDARNPYYIVRKSKNAGFEWAAITRYMVDPNDVSPVVVLNG